MSTRASRQPLRLSFSLATFSLFSLAACAPDTSGVDSGDDGVGAAVGTGAGAGVGAGPAGTGSTGAGSTGGDGDKGGITVKPPTVVGDDCGNGALDEGEECDDGPENWENSLDGCNQACQQSPDFDCPTPGQLCITNVACGDGKLHNTEACDPGDFLGEPGCAADCSAIDVGWQCRVPGRACIPLCGDSLLTAGENCDDGNAVAGDGCSSRCLTEPGWSCGDGVTIEACVQSVCGNEVTETGESCDAGASNGLFFGDGTGCSKTCTAEPVCRDAAGVTQACSTACGDGNIDTGETCDDGNAVDGDGCSSACADEGGFTCMAADKADTSDCPDGGGQCLILPITYRDFDSDHPDFFFYGDDGVQCVPSAGGDNIADSMECGADVVELCPGLAAATLGTDGKPVAGSVSSCECKFTDWDETGIISGGERCQINGGDDGERDRTEEMVTVVNSAATFNDWYHDSGSSTKVVDTLVLSELGGGQFQFDSGDTIPDKIAEGAGTTLDGGFFPLDAQTGTGSAQLCNIWPYWDESVWVDASGCAAEQWNPGDEEPQAFTGVEHNFYFTSEVRYLFKYAGGEKLAFFGDDDVFVYINGQLTLDLGAPHERLRGNVVLADAAATSTVERMDGTDSVTTTPMSLVPGSIYEIAVFHADRHPRDSNYQLTLEGFSTTQSECAPTCGDAVATTGEECDDGAANDDTLYGGCSTTCTYGPYCGDGVVNGEELCDEGLANNATYGVPGCTSACRPSSSCGDAVTDTGFGEECDDGTNNGTGACNELCEVVVVLK